MDINTVTLVGRLAEDVIYQQGTDPKGPDPKSSRAVARLIVNRPPSKSGDKRYDAIQIVAWGVHADNMATYTSKGKELAITGEIRVNNVPPAKEGGEWKNYVEVQIRTLSFGRDSNQAKVMKALQGSEGTLTDALSQGSNAQLAALAANPEMKAVLEAIVAQGLQAPATEAPKEEPAEEQQEEAASPDVETPFTDAEA